MIRVFIVDDHPLVRDSITKFLATESSLDMCGSAANAKEAMVGVERFRPDLVLLDLSLPGGNGLSLLKALHAYDADMLILMLSLYSEDIYAEQCLRLGASGYVMKSDAAEQLIPAIRSILAGEVFVGDMVFQRLMRTFNPATRESCNRSLLPLSIRELEVIRLLGDGHSVRQIGEMLDISTKTVESHRDKIKRKLGIPDNEQLTRIATEWLQNTSPVYGHWRAPVS